MEFIRFGRWKCVILLFFCAVLVGSEARAQLEAPQPVRPRDGRERELAPGRDDIEFVWNAVEDATGYLFTLSGPVGFRDLENVAIEPATPTVSRSFVGFVPGDYDWEVRATGLGTVSSATPFHFTVPAPLPTGGDLPPPILIGPPDYSIFRGKRGGRITFQWSPVPGATDYRLEVEAFQNSGTFLLDPVQTVDGGIIHQSVGFFPRPNSIGVFTWRVVPTSATQEGIGTPDAHLLFTAGDIEAEEILFFEALAWHATGALMDANGDNRTNAIDLAATLPFQKNGGILVVAQTGPNLGGQTFDAEGVTFSWKTVGGIDSYEVNIIDASGAFDSTFMSHPQSGVIDQTFRVEPLPRAGNYVWRVRGFFGFNLDTTPYSQERSFIVSDLFP